MRKKITLIQVVQTENGEMISAGAKDITYNALNMPVLFDSLNLPPHHKSALQEIVADYQRKKEG